MNRAVALRAIARPRAITWVFTAFFGCVSLLGPGWHALFGHHFHGGCAPSAVCCSDSGTTCSHAHKHAADRDAARVGATSHSQPAHSQPAGDRNGQASHGPQLAGLPDAPHHCPLCQFFGDAQWAEPFLPDELRLKISPLVDLTSQTEPIAVVGLHLARGPPAPRLA